jgi:hypothetical protein
VKGRGAVRGDAFGVTLRNNSGEVPAGHPKSVPLGPKWGSARRFGALRVGAAALGVLAVGAAVAGCGGADASGATVSVYVAAPLCAGAKAELASHGATAGHFTVAVRCLASSERAGGGVDLATDGANSRRATSDTSAVATLEPPGPGVKFTRAILESAEIPLVTSTSAEKGMKRILSAIDGAGSSSVRDSVREALESA